MIIKVKWQYSWTAWYCTNPLKTQGKRMRNQTYESTSNIKINSSMRKLITWAWETKSSIRSSDILVSASWTFLYNSRSENPIGCNKKIDIITPKRYFKTKGNHFHLRFNKEVKFLTKYSSGMLLNQTSSKSQNCHQRKNFKGILIEVVSWNTVARSYTD